MNIRRSLLIAPIALPFLLAGCKEGGPGSSGYLVKPGTERVRIAVLPFEVASPQYETAGQVVTQEIVTALLSTGLFEVVEPGLVYQALSESGSRNLYGLDRETMQALQQQVGPVRVFVVGLVQEFGEVRIGPESYPSVSLTARVLDGETGSIVWAGSVSKTGADSEKLFGIGAVHSQGRVIRAAVKGLIAKIDRKQLAEVLAAGPTQPVGPAVPRGPTPSGPPKVTGNERFFDEKATWTQAALTDLLLEVEGLTRAPVLFRQHHFDIVETQYAADGYEIRAKLVDYRQVKAAQGYVQLDHPGEAEQLLAGLPAYGTESSPDDPGAYVLDVAVGRFGLSLIGPAAHRADVEKAATAIIAAMK
ncbi:MAG: hypothetical protein FJX75_06350 [Armatimonadetes bacterium]|nr:hypothetical protein [Armatimonadota bacterium]